jgi:hypothetical protein
MLQPLSSDVLCFSVNEGGARLLIRSNNQCRVVHTYVRVNETKQERNSKSTTAYLRIYLASPSHNSFLQTDVLGGN